MEKTGLSGRNRPVMEGRSVADVQLFREDVVQRLSQPSLIGVVSKVGGDSDSSDDSETEEDEEENEEDVTEGCARVCWINSEESTEKLGDIQVVDRAFLHGDIVSKASDPLGQTGTVVDVEMKVDLELSNGEIMKDVNSRRLRRIRAFAIGDYVIHDLWLGRVDEVVDNVTVLFDDGAKCKVHRADPERLVPFYENVIDDTGCPYYPGQRVRCSTPSVFKNSKWLKGGWKVSRMEGTVIDVEAGSVLVYWIAAGNALSGSQLSSPVPNEEQDAKNLLPMIYFSHTNWQLGDRSLPPVKMRPKSVVPVGALAELANSDVDVDVETPVENNGARSPESLEVPSGGSLEGCKEAWIAHRRKNRQRRALRRDKKSQKKEKPVEYAVLIVNTRTTVDVVWQDGTVSQGLEASSLVPVDHLGDHDFWPEQYVLERGADGEGLELEPRRVGIVKIVDAKQRTATVRWLKNVQRPEEPREFESEEVVSVYELVEHPDYGYCLGDVVIRLTPAPEQQGEAPSVDDSDGALSSGVEDTSEVDAEDAEGITAREASSRSQKQSGKRKPRGGKFNCDNLSWVGVIIGLKDGDIEVAWADGMVSKVGPQAIFVVNRDLEEDSSSAHTSDLEDVEEDVDDAASWETVRSDEELRKQEQEQAWGESGKLLWEDSVGVGPGELQEDVGVEVHGKEETSGEPTEADNRVLRAGKKGDSSSGGGPRAAGSPVKLKHGLEDILDGDKDSGHEEGALQSPSDSVVDRAVRLKSDALTLYNEAVFTSRDREDDELDLTPSNTANDLDSEDRDSSARTESSSTPVEKLDQSILLSPDANTSSRIHYSETGGTPQDILHFDIVKDPSDHHYVGESTETTNNRKWMKKVQQDWAILQKNLPDTIYVRVYEDRMDLLRALIVGATGTPYHDGLFLFDLYLPPEYPSVPPVVHYHSGGLRLNPNLYENGKVCLSLLNTWTGKGSEIWHPSTSSILQLLVSIQGLVLNAKPYFNEAGYDRQIGTGEGEKNSLLYNENSFLLSCKSMLYLLRRPPMHFEYIIRRHFGQCGDKVIQACRAYLAGAEVGSLKDSDYEHFTDSNHEDKSSAGFKLMLKKLVPKLETALTEVGANISGG